LKVTNTGAVTGSEVVQLYVSDVESSLYRPAQELKAFAKVALDPGETQTVSFELSDAAFAVYDVHAQSQSQAQAEAWVVEAGDFEIRVGSSSRDIRLQQTLMVNSDQQVSAAQPGASGPRVEGHGLLVDDTVFAAMLGKPVPPPESVRPFHVNSSVSEIAQTWVGSRVRDRVVDAYQKRLGESVKDETLKKMFEEMANNMPLRSLALLGGGQMSHKSLNVLVAILNKQFLTALRLALRSQ
jgi:beta-glucosidase